ncbi:MAG: hypothetical protein OXK20_10110 [Deltaproteobacteria bacterium]|nr:hypothetical protein [Deltaproteobacteria bacterium]
MQILDSAEKTGTVAIPWILDPDHQDFDLEVDGCGCGCGGGCGCGCSCSCSCSCADTGANGDDDPNDSDDGGGAEDFSGPEYALEDTPTPASTATSPVISGCISTAASSSLGFDPIAELTGEHYDPGKDEDFITTGTRGLGDMMSPPVSIPAITSAVGSALGDSDCPSTIADAVNTVIDRGTEFASEANRQLEEADRVIQNAVDSIRDSLRN